MDSVGITVKRVVDLLETASFTSEKTMRETNLVVVADWRERVRPKNARRRARGGVGNAPEQAVGEGGTRRVRRIKTSVVVPQHPGDVTKTGAVVVLDVPRASVQPKAVDSRIWRVWIEGPSWHISKDCPGPRGDLQLVGRVKTLRKFIDSDYDAGRNLTTNIRQPYRKSSDWD